MITLSPSTQKNRKRRLSTRVVERRERIIQTVRTLIAKRGIEPVGMRDLAEECGVAVTTLYNQFGSREGVIGAALHAVFRDHFVPLAERTQNLSPAQQIDARITAATQAILGELREYSRSTMSFYFSPTPHPLLRSELHDFVVVDFRHVVEDIERRGDLEPWVDIPSFTDDIVTQHYSLVMKWVQGYIRDQDLHTRCLRAIGTSFMGVTHGNTRLEIKQLIAADAGRVAIVPTREADAI